MGEEGGRERRKRGVRRKAFLEEIGEKWRNGDGEESGISSCEVALLPFITVRMIHPLWVNDCVGSHEDLMVGGGGKNNMKKENEKKKQRSVSHRERGEKGVG